MQATSTHVTIHGETVEEEFPGIRQVSQATFGQSEQSQ